MNDFMDTFAFPVFVVNEGGEIQMANWWAQRLVNKGWSELEECRIGEVVECAYSTLSGGCGQTIHCLGCAIRRTVMATFETGKEFVRVPASLHIGEGVVRYTISTRRMGNMVLLSINEHLAPARQSDNGHPTAVSHSPLSTEAYFLP